MAEEQNSESFRDTISTVDSKGNRVWIHPKKPKGRYYNWRKILSYVLLLALFGLPYVKIGGEPFLMMNVIERKFSIIGQVFWPQDFYIFALMMITFVIFITLFTIIFGRLFCGWICPQTIFMEMVFRRVEYWIEGDWTHQKKLDKQPWNREKIFKKTVKHIIFWLISFAISNTFLSYIIGYEELWYIILLGPVAGFGGFMAIVIFTFVFYGVFAFMREQVCTTVCPYGRLQGVLMDKNSLVVAYDYVRGEGRGKFKKNEDRKTEGKGDCIDCKQCVHVCPTGIDIRNGTQLECVNCTACIDACDNIMDGVGLDRGLIRFASEENIKNKTPFIFTTRVKTYSAVLLVLLVLLSFMIISREQIDTTILRTRGTIFQKYDDTHFSNIFDVKILNKTRYSLDVELRVIEGPGRVEMVGGTYSLKESDEFHGKMLLIIDKKDLVDQIPFTIGIYEGDELIQEVETSFIGPNI